MRVRDPEGQVWRVTRRWVPWRLRRRNPSPDVELDGFDGGLVIGLVVLVVGLVVWPLIGFLLVGVLEALLLALLVPIAAGVRILFGRHWWIEARRGFRPYWEEQAGAWGVSGRRIREVAAAIEHGDPPLRTLGVDAEAQD